MDISTESLLKEVIKAADIEILWEKPATGESGFISRQPYSSGGDRPVTGDERLSHIPTAFHEPVTAALSQVGAVVEYPFKQDGWFDYQWFEMRLMEERKDTDGECIRIYYSRRIQASKQLELMLKEALDADRKNVVEENLTTGEARYLYKYSKNPDLEPQLAGSRRENTLGEQAQVISETLEQPGVPVEFRSMLPGREDLDWVRQTNIRNFRNEQGDHCRLLLVKNITQEKQAALALEAAYERLRRSTRMGDVGTFTYDVSTDLFDLDETSRTLMALPKQQFPLVDSDKLLSYAIGFSAQQMRESITYQQQNQGTQTFELNVRSWDGIHRWVKFRFEFLDSSDGWQACGVIIDVSDSVRNQYQINQQLRRLEEQERVVDTVIDTAQMTLIEIDLDTGMGEVVRGSTSHLRMLTSFDVDKVQRQIYQPEDYERQKIVRDNPGQVALVRTYDVSGEEFLYWSTLGYSEPYRRDGRVYQLLYRRIVDDVEQLSAQMRELSESVN